jgi:NitT/TauT family transport system substrate-binding protein
MKMVLLVLGLCFISSFSSAKDAAVPVDKSVQILLNWKAEPEFGGFYQAQLGGAFAKRGLKADVVEGGASTPTVQMVAAGKQDFAIVSGDELVISRSKGSDVVAVFAVYQKDPHGIMVHESGAKNLKELLADPSATVALQRGVPYTIFIQKKYAPVKAKIVPYTGGISTFLNDTKFAQQCFVTSEPISAKKQGKQARAFLIADEGYNPYSTVLVTRQEIIRKKPELVKAVVESVRDGWNEYLKNPETANKYMASLNKAIDLATFNEIAETQKSLIVTDETKTNGVGTMTAARWKQLADQLSEMKLISKKPDAQNLFQQL